MQAPSLTGATTPSPSSFLPRWTRLVATWQFFYCISPLILPVQKSDGFFYACLLKVRSGEVSLLCRKLTLHSLYLLTAVMNVNRSRSFYFPHVV